MTEINKKVIHLAGGCFWGLEKYVQNIPGVISTEVGYANGRTTHAPTYDEVCHDDTGHAETVKVEYDSNKISLLGLLKLYYMAIDPTSVNHQGHDAGTQYRTGIYYSDKSEIEDINKSISLLQNEYKKPIAIEVQPLNNYYAAEDYHQKYLDKDPGGYCHISQKLFDYASKAIVDPFDYKVSDKETLRKKLKSIEFDVTMNSRTERPYDNEYWNHFEEGLYVDITTGEPLFTSKDKIESCGWPSFTSPIDPDVINNKMDFSHGMIRAEVRSRVGDAHLGHVFDDGPKEAGGKRYCINSASLRFIPREKMEEEGYGKFLSLFN